MTWKTEGHRHFLSVSFLLHRNLDVLKWRVVGLRDRQNQEVSSPLQVTIQNILPALCLPSGIALVGPLPAFLYFFLFVALLCFPSMDQTPWVPRLSWMKEAPNEDLG